MLIKLTNAAEEHKGNNLFINPEWIVAVFQTPSPIEDKLSTVVYGGPQGTSWNVNESPEQIQRLINTITD